MNSARESDFSRDLSRSNGREFTDDVARSPAGGCPCVSSRKDALCFPVVDCNTPGVS
jgi:hypothetical protein